jgi:hypothetical protein
MAIYHVLHTACVFMMVESMCLPGSSVIQNVNTCCLVEGLVFIRFSTRPSRCSRHHHSLSSIGSRFSLVAGRHTGAQYASNSLGPMYQCLLSFVIHFLTSTVVWSDWLFCLQKNAPKGSAAAVEAAPGRRNGWALVARRPGTRCGNSALSAGLIKRKSYHQAVLLIPLIYRRLPYITHQPIHQQGAVCRRLARGVGPARGWEKNSSPSLLYPLYLTIDYIVLNRRAVVTRWVGVGPHKLKIRLSDSRGGREWRNRRRRSGRRLSRGRAGSASAKA